ncbi:MAG: cadherin repeat domain-containing protein [Chloroflexi bacterium]|nr:cadherin repeat domain-containing protein [Chloroflexota bacterium]
MNRNQVPSAGWQGTKPPGNGEGRRRLPLLALMLVALGLILALGLPNGTPAMAQGPRTPSDASAAATVQAPQVTRTTLVSSPAVGDTYGLNEMIKVGLFFDTPVNVQGKLSIGVYIGSRWYGMPLLDGSGSDCLIFGRRVMWDDTDGDGVVVPGGYVDGQGQYHGFIGRGSITDAMTGVAASRLFPGVNDSAHSVDWRHSVKITDDSVISSPEDGHAYRAGEALEVQLTYEENMVVEGQKGISIYVGDVEGSWRGAHYERGAGTDKLVFSYTVKRTDVDATGFSVSSGSRESGYFGSGFVRSQATGLYSSFGYRALHDQSGHNVLGSDDLVSPTVSELKVITQPEDRGYVAGEEIRVDVVFDENVTADGSAELELDFNGEAKTAVLVRSALLIEAISGPAAGANTLTFIYEVVKGDHDPDGFAIGENKLRLTSGTIRDAAGNDANLDHSAVPAAAIQCIDARNLPPVFDEGSSASRTVDEELDRGSLVGDPIVASDPNGTPLTLALSGDDAERFSIDSSGQITNVWRLSYESRSHFDLVVSASDGVSTTSLDLTIQVTDIDEPGQIRLEWPPPVCTPVLHAYVYEPDREEQDHVWTWEISSNGEDGWTTIGHVESWDSTYSPTPDQAHKFLRLTVTYSDKFGADKSAQVIEEIGPIEPLQKGCNAEGLGTIG